jgi:hypothetical protein
VSQLGMPYRVVVMGEVKKRAAAPPANIRY